MAIALLLSPLVKKARSKPLPAPIDFMAAAFALGGTITLLKVLVRVATQEALQAELDLDGVFAICIGSTAGIYLALREFLKILF